MIFDSITNDVRYALRMMRRTPMFTAAVVLTVAIAIAANSTIFTVVNAVMIRSLPFGQPNRILQVAEKNDKLHLPSFGASVLNFLDWREQTHTFEQLAGLGFATVTLSGNGDPEQLSGNLTSPALMQVLGLTPVAGRTFIADEEKPNGAAVAMIGEGLWKRRFAADPNLIGHTILLDGAQTTVVGIAPAGLKQLSGGDVYLPLIINPSQEIRLNHVILAFGRLNPGVTPQQAQAEMNTISARMGKQYPEVKDWGIHLIPLFDTFVTSDFKTALIVLFVAVLFVLLIACANIANLLLARAATRQKEMAVRTAMGATRTQLIRQLLVESVVLAAAGGVAGVLGAIAAVRVLTHSLPDGTLPVPNVGVDSNVLWFAFGLTVTTGLLFGLAPAFRIAKVRVNETLKEAGRGSMGGMMGGTRSWLRNGLAAGELALAAILLIGAGLLIQSLANLQRVRLGFDSQGLMTFQLAPPVTKYPLPDKAPQFYRSLVDGLQSIPGVRAAAASTGIPFGAGNYSTHPMFTAEPSLLPPGAAVPIDWRNVSPGYFSTMHIPLLRGRTFTDSDTSKPPLVMVVSQNTAKKFWGDADPIGKTLRPTAAPAIAYTIVGVVGDVRDSALNQESPTLYYSIAERGAAGLMDVVVRTEGSPEALMPAIRQKVHELDPELALANVNTMDQWLSNSAALPRLNTALLTVFAAVALIIAAIGIYGVLAYSVNQRTREIGLRMALGATPGSVLQLIVGEGMKVVLVGVVIGLAGGLALGRTVSSLVFGVPVRDPVTFGLVAVVLALIALAACAIPARRAARVDPMVALRYE